MKGEIRTAIILGAGIAAAVAAMSVVFSMLDEEVAVVTDGLPVDKSGFKTAPGIVGIAHYINTTPEGLDAAMKDKVVLYDIWTYSCINCIRTLPYITAWDEKYSDQGLLIVGVHSPEFEFEKDPANVERAVTKYGIQYPVVMDNDWETWKAFENRYWPRKYVADHEGFIRYDHIGEGAYDETERVIQALLRERADAIGVRQDAESSLVDIEEFVHTPFRTPELYFGYGFAEWRNHLGSSEGFRPGTTVTYEEPDEMVPNFFYMIGDWHNHEESMELVSDAGLIRLEYTARQVNIVTDGEADLTVLLDGQPVTDEHAGDGVSGGALSVSEPNLYNVIDSPQSGKHVLEIRVDGAGFEIFTFTFG